MRAADWYVIQVETGREIAACEDIARVCAQAERHLACAAGDRACAKLLHECFAPRYKTQYKRHGKWHDEERLLLPGYVVAVTSNPWELVRKLGVVPRFTKLLTMGETFVPLGKDDRAWIERWTSEGNRTIPMSVAYKEGDQLVVTEGPLKGYEGMIVRVRRRLNLAELEIHAGQITIHTTVGLAVKS